MRIALGALAALFIVGCQRSPLLPWSLNAQSLGRKCAPWNTRRCVQTSHQVVKSSTPPVAMLALTTR